MKHREPVYTLLSANQHCVRSPKTHRRPERYYVKLELISSASFSLPQIIVQFVLEMPRQADTWFTDILIELHRLISSYTRIVSFDLPKGHNNVFNINSFNSWRCGSVVRVWA